MVGGGSLDDDVRKVYMVLESLGYKPVIVGTYALVLQGWLPRSYIDRTKDIDIYVDDPAIAFDTRFEGKLLAIGLPMGRSESGGIYASSIKPIEVVYPVFDFYIPRLLLEHTVLVGGLRILEGHAVLVAKSLGSDIADLADYLLAGGAVVDVDRLRALARSIAREVDREAHTAASRRVEEFIERYGSRHRSYIADRDRDREVVVGDC